VEPAVMWRHEWSCPTAWQESCDCLVMPVWHRVWLRLLASRRWPELPDDEQQSVQEQIRVRSEWIRTHRIE